MVSEAAQEPANQNMEETVTKDDGGALGGGAVDAGQQALEQSYTYEGQPYQVTTRRSKITGFVGAKPSSLAALATGKRYLSDPLTPLTPRPNRDMIRTATTGPPLATTRSNHWVTQTSQGYLPVRLQNHRIPKTPIEHKVGYPARPVPAASTWDRAPRYMVDQKGHLLSHYRKPNMQEEMMRT